MQYKEFDNALSMNQYMTNTQLSFSMENMTMDVLWFRLHHTPNPHAPKPSARHHHQFCEAHLVTRGSMDLLTGDNQIHHIHEGEIALIPENVAHQILLKPDQLQRISFGYRLIQGNKVFSRSEDQPPLDAVVIPCGEPVYEIYQQISTELRERRPGYAEMVQVLLFRAAMFHEQYIKQIAQAKEHAENCCALGNDILRYIQKHVFENITVTDVANAVRLSDRQVNRNTNRDFSMPCSRLIRSMKHQRAQEMLVYTDQSMQEIAEALGYSSLFSFSKFFKAMEGMPPLHFRQAHQSY